eukprot:GHVS01023473.1.p1 GENE.GHVS01023473.1~~GHVS01023473.1.p1  ORF type:complete len:767 (-),score=205.06 GHVS01023473.1:762-3062(-)
MQHQQPPPRYQPYSSFGGCPHDQQQHMNNPSTIHHQQMDHHNHQQHPSPSCSPPSAPTTASPHYNSSPLLPSPPQSKQFPPSQPPFHQSSEALPSPSGMVATPRMCVEVCKDTSDRVFYIGTLVDLLNGLATVQFEDLTWGTQQLPADQVRAPRHVKADMQTDEVEAFEEAKDHTPSRWSIGRVTQFRQDHVKVTFDNRTASNQNLYSALFELSHIRVVSKEPRLVAAKLYRGMVSLPPSIRAWAASSDAHSLYSDVACKTGVLLISYDGFERDATEGPPVAAADAVVVDQPDSTTGSDGVGSSSEGGGGGRNNDNKGMEHGVLLIGEPQKVKSAKQVLEVHIKHQKELQAGVERKNRKLIELQQKQSKMVDGAKTEFITEDRLVGLIIGKHGDHLRGVESKFGVEVRINPVSDGHQPSSEVQLRHRVTICGPDDASVEAAKKELEFVYRDYPVDQRLVGWILGKKGVNIKDVSQRSGLFSAYFEDQSKTFILCGTKQSVEDAVMLLDSHASYYDEYKKLNQQEQEIDRNLSMLGGHRGGGGGYHGGGGHHDGGGNRGGGGPHVAGGGPHGGATAGGQFQRGGGRSMIASPSSANSHVRRMPPAGGSAPSGGGGRSYDAWEYKGQNRGGRLEQPAVSSGGRGGRVRGDESAVGGRGGGGMRGGRGGSSRIRESEVEGRAGGNYSTTTVATGGGGADDVVVDATTETGGGGAEEGGVEKEEGDSSVGVSGGSKSGGVKAVNSGGGSGRRTATYRATTKRDDTEGSTN